MRTRLTDKGQITIPREIQERLGLHAGDEVELVEDGDGLRIRAARSGPRFEAWRGHLRHLKGQNPDALVDEIRGN
jgi:AbrB family looped-hinge helix DNA binding protein